MLNIQKAEQVLGWAPTFTADIAISKTVEWYKKFYENNKNMYEFTIKQIEEYEKGMKWNKSYAIK